MVRKLPRGAQISYLWLLLLYCMYGRGKYAFYIYVYVMCVKDSWNCVNLALNIPVALS